MPHAPRWSPAAILRWVGYEGTLAAWSLVVGALLLSILSIVGVQFKGCVTMPVVAPNGVHFEARDGSLWFEVRNAQFRAAPAPQPSKARVPRFVKRSEPAKTRTFGFLAFPWLAAALSVSALGALMLARWRRRLPEPSPQHALSLRHRASRIVLTPCTWIGVFLTTVVGTSFVGPYLGCQLMLQTVGVLPYSVAGAGLGCERTVTVLAFLRSPTRHVSSDQDSVYFAWESADYGGISFSETNNLGDLVDRTLNTTVRVFHVVAPAWFALGILGLLTYSLRAMRAYRRWCRRIRGPYDCPHCGYDLRHSPTRCPECGIAVRSAPKPT